MFNTYPDSTFHIICLMIDGSTSVWAQQYGLTFPVLNDHSRTMWDIYGEGYIPLNIVVDPDFIIRYKQSGYSESQIISTIEAYLPP